MPAESGHLRGAAISYGALCLERAEGQLPQQDIGQLSNEQIAELVLDGVIFAIQVEGWNWSNITASEVVTALIETPPGQT